MTVNSNNLLTITDVAKIVSDFFSFDLAGESDDDEDQVTEQDALEAIAENYREWRHHEFYFDVECDEPEVSFGASFRVDNRWLDQIPNLNGLVFSAYFPHGVKPRPLTTDEERQGFGIGKGNSNWSMQCALRIEDCTVIPLDVEALEEFLERAVDKAIDLMVGD